MDPSTFLTLTALTAATTLNPAPPTAPPSLIFNQVTACPDTDANNYVNIPSCLCSFLSSSSSQLVLTYKNSTSQASNAMLSSYDEALTEICNVIDVCGFTEEDLSTGVSGTIILTPTGTGEPVTGKQKQIEVKVSLETLVGTIDIVAMFV